MFPQILRLRRRLLLRFYFFFQNDDSWQSEYDSIHRNIVLGNFLGRKILKRIYRKHYSKNFLFKAICKKTCPVRKILKKRFQNESWRHSQKDFNNY